MARCETCGRKLKNPTQRFCGKSACEAKEIIPRCTGCGQLIHAGIVNTKCPATGQSHTVVSGGDIVSADTISVITKDNYNKGV